MSAFCYEQGSDGIAVIGFDMGGAGANRLTASVMEELDLLLSRITNDGSIRGLVIKSNKKEQFIVGADISEILRITDPSTGAKLSLRGQSIFRKLELLPYPTVAAIHGACLGGGLELALACSCRIVSDDTKTVLGMPEVKLGLIPGFGGTQRLPKLVGIRRALELILSGRHINRDEAKRIGLVDGIVQEKLLVNAAKDIVKRISGGIDIGKPEKRYRITHRLIDKSRIWKRLLYKTAGQKMLAKTKGHYPAPVYAIAAISAGTDGDLQEGYKIEARLLGELSVTDVSRNLISLFLTKKDMEKRPFGKHEDDSADIRRVGVIGAGVMGSGIAQLLAEKNFEVILKVKNKDSHSAASCPASVMDIFRRRVKKGLLTHDEAKDALNRISVSDDYSEFINIGLVIEATTEDMDVKKNELAKFRQTVNHETPYATNTSSLSITDLAETSPKSGRVAGMHFFNPVDMMPLVEIVKGKHTEEGVVASLIKLAKSLGKVPVVVSDYPGFLVNRVLSAYFGEAVELFEEGQDIKWIDAVLVDFGMPVGPFALMDMIGIDIVRRVGLKLKPEGSLKKRHNVLNILNDIGHTGRKNGMGFYKYNSKGSRLGVSRRLYRETKVRAADERLEKSEIEDRMMLIMLKEAVFCLQNNIIDSAEYLDASLVFGIGFPPFRGGLLKFMDEVGRDSVDKKMAFLASKYGERFNFTKPFNSHSWRT